MLNKYTSKCSLQYIAKTKSNKQKTRTHPPPPPPHTHKYNSIQKYTK